MSMEIAECIFCQMVVSLDKEDLAGMRKLATKTGRKMWKSTDILQVITKMSGDCEKKEGEDKDHVLRWNEAYINGNIELASKCVAAQSKLESDKSQLEQNRKLLEELERHIEETKSKIGKGEEAIQVDGLEFDNNSLLLEDRTAGKDANIWV
jgi:hypothetical protein